MSNEFDSIRDVVRDGIARAIAIVGLAGIALIHLLDAPGTFQGSAYKGWLYVALIVGCVGAAAALIRASDPRAWAAAALLAAGAMLAYVISRTIGLPQGADDIGNWNEPLGIARRALLGAAAVVLIRSLQSGASVGPCLSPRSHVAGRCCGSAASWPRSSERRAGRSRRRRAQALPASRPAPSSAC